ncbi:MAG: pepN [Frankiales bacterium]|nr:pepN [Frankiales bacterium]
MPSLKLVEAGARAGAIEVENYRIALDLRQAEQPDAGFGCATTISFRAHQPDAETFVDIKAERVHSASLNGQPIDVAAIRDGRLALTGLLAANELHVLSEMAYSTDGEGLHRHVDPADGRTYLYAMSFLDAGPRWFACFDQPDLKATYDVTVRCPTDWTVLGNGAPRSSAPGEWTLATTKPLSTYFVTLVAGPYHSIRSEHDGITLGVHARASLAAHLQDEAEEIFAVTARAFDRYHELFGLRYPFGEYHQAFVPDFNAGAMENPGCVTLRDQYVFRSATTTGERGVRANTIVHELAHMWFGDLVTMRWWDDLWLNESFAEYMAHRVCSEITDYAAWSEFGIRRKDWGYVADQAPSTHPVAGNGSADAAGALADFDGISYAKGAAALKQLASYLGDDVFFGGLRAYFTQHAFGNAEFSDLIAAWTAAGGVAVDEWARQWLRTAGLDTISAEPTATGLALTRRSPDTSDRPHALRVNGYASDGSLVLDETVVLAGEPVRLTSPQPIALAVADAEDDTWAKIRFGPAGWTALAALLPQIANPLSRVVAYNAVRDAVRDAELDPARALDVLLSASQFESDPYVVGDLWNFAIGSLAGPYSPPEQRPARRERIAEVALGQLRSAEPGSDGQLVAARSFIRTTGSSQTLLGWLDGRERPDGLRIDAELRWALVGALATMGAVDEDFLAAELAADLSASGAGHAARARAALPLASSKARAWALLTEPSAASAYELYATAEGFFPASQDELTAPYVPRFFTEIPATAAHRKGFALARVALLAYPHSSAARATLELAAAALARAELDGGIRRSLIDASDAQRRAVVSQQRYRSS